MIPTGAVEPGVSPSAPPDAVAQRKRDAPESESESEQASSSSSEQLSSSDEDEVMPSSKRAKRGAAGTELRRTTRAAARNAASGMKGSNAAERKQGGRKATAERVVAGSDSEKGEPAQPAPGKGGRRRMAFAEHDAKADEVAAGAVGVMLPPPPPIPPVKQLITAAGALRAKEAVLEVCAIAAATMGMSGMDTFPFPTGHCQLQAPGCEGRADSEHPTALHNMLA